MLIQTIIFIYEYYIQESVMTFLFLFTKTVTDNLILPFKLHGVIMCAKQMFSFNLELPLAAR